MLKLYPGQYSPRALSESLLGNNVLSCSDIPSNEGGRDRLSGVLGRRYTLVDLLQPTDIYGWGKSVQAVSGRAQFPHDVFPEHPKVDCTARNLFSDCSDQKSDHCFVTYWFMIGRKSVKGGGMLTFDLLEQFYRQVHSKSWTERGRNGNVYVRPGSSDLTLAAPLRRRYRGVLKANSTHNIAHFTCATPISDTPMFT